MAATSLQELFVEELRDIYDGEKRLLRALPKMAKAAGARKLQSAFAAHARETERQVDRLEQVFRAMGLKPRGKTCDGIVGIVEEGQRHIQELEGPVLDAALIAGAQKVEHYEIATYGTLAYYAELLGHTRAKDLLGETLDEEKATDEKLSGLARSDVNRQALTAGAGMQDEEDEESEETAGFMGGMRRAMASIGMAEERSSGIGRASASDRSSRGPSSSRVRAGGGSRGSTSRGRTSSGRSSGGGRSRGSQ
jgi:ferritin-like metal-binding protein YciE